MHNIQYKLIFTNNKENYDKEQWIITNDNNS